MKLTKWIAAGTAIVAASSIAWAAGMFSTLPIVGGASFCASQVTGFGGQICGQTIPAGPQFVTGNELIPADTVLAGGASPQTVVIPSGVITPRVNTLIGGDFGQNLWQRGTSFASITPASATLTADGFYVIENTGTTLQTITVSKQTGSSDVPSGSLASMRVQRVASQTGTAQTCVGQLVPDADSGALIGNAQNTPRTVVFSVDMLAGANFSPTNSSVNMIIAYHTAADVTSGAANGQGTNTATFATSDLTTQSITNYIEAVRTPTVIGTTWARYSTSAIIPQFASGTSTQVTGVGVKLCWTPVGTAGTNDFVEIGKVQLEGRIGQSTGASPFEVIPLALDWSKQLARYYTILENGTSGTPFYATGYVPTTSLVDVMVQFPQLMRITPVVSPITTGGFKFLVAGTATTPASVTTAGTGSVTPRTAGIVGVGVGSATTGQGAIMTGSGAGTGVLGFSAEP